MKVLLILLVIIAVAVGAWLIFRGSPSECNINDEVRFGTGSPGRSLGSFTIRHTIQDRPFRNGISMTLEFDPSGGSGSSCEVGFIQIVRTVSLRDPSRFLYPTSQKAHRATTQGWYIDQPDGYASPIYGRNNNRGTTPPYFPSDKVQLGTRSATGGNIARMTDSPYRRDYPELRCILWQAVTVPVCLSPDFTCHEPVDAEIGLGYYAWSWIVTDDGHVKDIQDGPANASLVDQVDLALTEWNNETAWGTERCPPPPRTGG